MSKYKTQNINKRPEDAFKHLQAGQILIFSGVFYTARDQAHRRLVELIRSGKKLPFDLKKVIIYYCGPVQSPPGRISGACGPTTSARMDSFLEPLLKCGVAATVGKGRRSRKARKLIKKYRRVYFVAPAGCGALLAEKVTSKARVCFPELGPEAVYRLRVEKFPLLVAIDSQGKSIYSDI